MGRLALLILDERAKTDDMIKSLKELNNLMREKYMAQGITVLANDEAIDGKESDFAMKANTQFFLDWKINPEYRSLIRDALQGGEIYAMRQSEDGWKLEKATNGDYLILNEFENINLKPSFN